MAQDESGTSFKPIEVPMQTFYQLSGIPMGQRPQDEIVSHLCIVVDLITGVHVCKLTGRLPTFRVPTAGCPIPDHSINPPHDALTNHILQFK